MTVADVIEQLKLMPQDMEVWITWDESGEYFPARLPQCRIDWIILEKRRGKTRWESSDEEGVGKAVCILSNTNC